MSSPHKVKRQIDDLVGHLVEVGLSSDQNYSVRRDLKGGQVEVTFPNATAIGAALKDVEYGDVYKQMTQARAFNVSLLDGALLQMTYLFDRKGIKQHRLAFLPAPHLSRFEDDPENYLQEALYADIVARNIVPFPLRFDFDGRKGVHRVLHHPKSHLTLGQYANCRIPVTAPLSPYIFVDFVLRNFYNTAFLENEDTMPRSSWCFDECIDARERGVLHVTLPPPGTRPESR